MCGELSEIQKLNWGELASELVSYVIVIFFLRSDFMDPAI